MFKIYFIFEMASFRVHLNYIMSFTVNIVQKVRMGERMRIVMKRQCENVKSGSGRMISFIIYDAFGSIHNAQASLGVSM